VISEIADSLISNFQGRLSFRNINKEMHRIFISTYISANKPKQYRIDLPLYEKAMKVPSPGEVMRHLTEKTAKGEEK